MKLKDYSMRIKKNIAVFLHVLFLTLVVTGITFMYQNMHYGKGIAWLTDSHYEDSPEFSEQVQQDIDSIFQYVAYRDIFELNGSLNMNAPMVTVSFDTGMEVTYTLDEMIRYAKSQGYYLNDSFEVVNDTFLYDNTVSKDPKVVWRAYLSEEKLSEPGAAYVSLKDLSIEVLTCLGKYYYAMDRFQAKPSNLYYQIYYEDTGNSRTLYSNAPDHSITELKKMGRYCFLTGNSAMLDTNFNEVPKNISASLEEYNPYDTSTYYMIVSVDTSFSQEDIYANSNDKYRQLRSHYMEGLCYLILGLAGCLVTLYYLILVSGYQTSDLEHTYLHGFDMVSTESCAILTAIATMFALFLGEKIGYKLLHLLVDIPNWPYAERMLRAIIIYSCVMTGAFSMLRRYKSGTLWSGSLIHTCVNHLSEYFAHKEFTIRLAFFYSLFLVLHVACFFLAGLLQPFWHFWFIKAALAVVFAGFAGFDWWLFHKLFTSEVQLDKISVAIDNIALGDTSYQVDLADFSGKEREMAQRLNSIGIGLEHALQEKVKSERLKADLITNVSHDIKTPLTSIINYVDLIKREKIQDPKIQEYLNVLEQKSQRLKNLTEDLVEASKASSGNLKLEIADIDLVELVYQTNGEFEEKFAQRNLELVCQLPDERILISADGRRLWRVLENLYNNAAKYAMEQSRVYVNVDRHEDNVYFTIKNVSERPLNVQGDELTERFVRGDVSRTTEGSGLGLSIAKSLTDLQNGSFQIMIDGDLFKVQVGFEIKSSDRTEETDHQ